MRSEGERLSAPPMFPLSMAETSRQVRIRRILGGHGLANRLCAMGLAPGMQLLVVRNDRGGPLIVGVQDSRFMGKSNTGGLPKLPSTPRELRKPITPVFRPMGIEPGNWPAGQSLLPGAGRSVPDGAPGVIPRAGQGAMPAARASG
jgi:Fe2+ transport system protein FeoA